MAVTDDDQMRATVSTVRIVERAFGLLVAGLEPSDFLLRDVTGVWSAFDRMERMASAAKTLLASRVDDAGDWQRAGARSAADHLAKLGGISKRDARRAMATSKQISELPAVADAMRAGGLSATQAGAVAGAAAADPTAQERLIGLAQSTNVNELREECLRTRAAADPDRDATYARIRAERGLRAYTDAEGARHLAARGPVDRVGLIETALKPLIDDLYARARASGEYEAREAYAFDALVTLADHDTAADETPAEGTAAEGPAAAGTPADGTERDESDRVVPVKKRRAPRYTALLHADLEALARGAVEGEEKCEIVGIGPVPVRVAREVLGDAILKLVITKGVDVANVVHLGRGPTAAQRIALLWTSPKCSNVECSGTFTEIDHRAPWANTKHTVLDELDPLCTHDHALKTNHGWSLIEGKGRRTFVSPDDPRHPRNKPPP